MNKNIYVWNTNGNRCVKLSLIKEFYIREFDGDWMVRGQLSGSDYIVVKVAKSQEDATEWLRNSLAEWGGG